MPLVACALAQEVAVEQAGGHWPAGSKRLSRIWAADQMPTLLASDVMQHAACVTGMPPAAEGIMCRT